MEVEKIKINVLTPRMANKALDVEYMYETKDELLIKLSDKTCYEIFPGQTLTFSRQLSTAFAPVGEMTQDVTVISEDDDHVLHTTKLPVNRARIYNKYPTMEKTTIDDVLYTVLRCDDYHNIFAQDLDTDTGQRIYIKDINDNLLATYDKLAVPFMSAYKGFISGGTLFIPDPVPSAITEYVDSVTPDTEPESLPQSDGPLKPTGMKVEPLGAYDTLEALQAAHPTGNNGDNYRVQGAIYTWSDSNSGWTILGTPKFIIGGEYVNLDGYQKVTIDDCIEFVGEEKTCGKDYDKIKTYRYDFFKTFFSRNNLLVEDVNGQNGGRKIEDYYPFMSYLETRFNPFYFYTVQPEDSGITVNGSFTPEEWVTASGDPSVQKNGSAYTVVDDIYRWRFVDSAATSGYWESVRTIKKCQFYEDNWWSRIENTVHPIWEKYVNSGATKSQLLLPTGFWAVSGGFGMDGDDENLGSDEALEEYLKNDMIQELIPPVVDMERVKYVPVISDGGEEETYSLATGITIDLHFRKRHLNDGSNANLSANNVYADGWYVADEDWKTAWWNGMEYSGQTFSDTEFKRFLRDKGSTSDLLGYLNFTDDDVFYRKKKVSQTFIRLLFYNSPYLDSQKLLYYSTVFLDSTNLFGKYIRQNLFIDESGGSTAYPNFLKSLSEEIRDGVKVVFCEDNKVSGRVDSEIEITNEFDRLRSAEGFNLYLFAEDVDLKDVDEEGNEKDERTIYMRVEFNHAGNGQTIPMIQAWPKSGSTYVPLTTQNYIDSLYIPIKIKYINDRYVYYIPSAQNSEDGNIRLVLFEPKLDKEIAIE